MSLWQATPYTAPLAGASLVVAGDEVARKLRDQNPAMALILVSGWDLPDEDPRLAPFDFYLHKPFDTTGVRRIVDAALQLTHQRCSGP